MQKVKHTAKKTSNVKREGALSLSEGQRVVKALTGIGRFKGQSTDKLLEITRGRRSKSNG